MCVCVCVYVCVCVFVCVYVCVVQLPFTQEPHGTLPLTEWNAFVVPQSLAMFTVAQYASLVAQTISLRHCHC